MNVLVVDVGGTNVKILATGQTEPRKFPSGPTLTAKQMVAGVKKLARDWKYDVVSIGYPGMVVRNRPLAEPYNLGRGWMGFDFEAAFKRPVKVVNDAAMQALGSYKRGKMLFLGLGTGLGSAMIVDGIVEPMELAIFPTRRGPMKIMSASEAWRSEEKTNGGGMSRTWWSASLPLSNPTTWFLAEATSRN